MGCWGIVRTSLILIFSAGLASPAFAHTDTSSSCARSLTESKLEHQWTGHTLVLDTNVILNDPYVIYKYAGATIVLSGTVLQELDKLKGDPEIGMASREFSRLLDKIVKAGGRLHEGVNLDAGVTLKVDIENYTGLLENKLDPAKNDNRIIATALHFKTQGQRTVLLSDDINVRIVASIFDIPTSESTDMNLPEKVEEGFVPYITAVVSPEELEAFKRDGRLPKPAELPIRPNQYVMFKTENEEGSIETLARYYYDRENPSQSRLQKLLGFKLRKVNPRNIEQAMLADLSLDPTVDMVVGHGIAGTGKNVITMAAASEMIEQHKYAKGFVTRTLVEMGGKIGDVPGDMNAKLSVWFQNFTDAREAILKIEKEASELNAVDRMTRNQRRGMGGGKNVAQYLNFDAIPFSRIRGRTLSGAYVIFDEAQNTSKHEAKALLTRAGEGTKMIVIGDVTQIDSRFLSRHNNGLADLLNRLREGKEYLSDEEMSRFGIVVLVDGTRSPLVNLVNKIYKK